MIDMVGIHQAPRDCHYATTSFVVKLLITSLICFLRKVITLLKADY